ncbi:MAG: hypothetical protein KTR32_38155 [Granulosicoccus sp.]|nr:hypothetical protein [Granulosicoccus sp.]
MVSGSEDRKIQRDTTSERPAQTDAPDAMSALLVDCASGNEISLATLYRLSAAKVFAVLLRSLKVQSFAEEALQNTYCTLWKNAGEYQSQLGSPISWMLAIARDEARAISQERDVWKDLSEESNVDRTPAVPLSTSFAQVDQQTRQSLVALYCNGSTLQSYAEKTSESTAVIRDRLRNALRLMSEGDNDSA